MICSLSGSSNLASRVQDERRRRRINLVEAMHPAGRCRAAHAGAAGSRKLILSVLRFNLPIVRLPFGFTTL